MDQKQKDEGMKWFFLSLVFYVTFAGANTFSAEKPQASSSEHMEALSTYVGERLDLDDVDCSNILPFIESYLEFSTANQLYINIFANRFLDAVDQVESAQKNGSHRTQKDPYTCMGGEVDLQDDIACAVGYIEENTWTLADQAQVIKEVLPQCLSSEK